MIAGKTSASIKQMRFLSITFFSLAFGFVSQVYAEACSYDEAILALRQGNEVRALALLRMAARDGDKRADQVLADLQVSPPNSTSQQAAQANQQIASQLE